MKVWIISAGGEGGGTVLSVYHNERMARHELICHLFNQVLLCREDNGNCTMKIHGDSSYVYCSMRHATGLEQHIEAFSEDVQ